MNRIDLNQPESTMPTGVNCDMGESYGIYTLGSDEDIMPHITAANVACGFHAGDPSVMASTIASAKSHDVAVGAHPSLPDLQGFGRREMKMDPEELTSLVTYQVGALRGFLHTAGMELNHIKVHGSLYGMTARDRDLAAAVCEVVKSFGVTAYGMAGTMHEEVAAECGVPFVSEFYADLDYGPDGNLIISRSHSATDPVNAAERVRRAIREGRVTSVDGTDVVVRADTVCVHSDTPNASELVAVVAAVVGEENGTG